MRARRALALAVLAPLAAGASEAVDDAIEPYGFFDFLGEMVEDDSGEWVDPLDMEALAEDAGAQRDEDDGRPLKASGDDDDE